LQRFIDQNFLTGGFAFEQLVWEKTLKRKRENDVPAP
jgi:hypothetical protein